LRFVLFVAMNDRPASWRMPNRQQMEKRLARERDRMVLDSEPAPDAPPPAEWWDSVLTDPRAAGKPIEQRRLSEVLRVECLSTYWVNGKADIVHNRH
jgi:hypothetical protein